MTDITEQGAQSYRDLQNQNNKDFTTPQPDGGTIGRLKILRQLDTATPSVRSTTYGELPTDFGDSRYDRNTNVPLYNMKDLENYRGEQQSGFAQLGAGLAKGVGLAATTFLDGTLGLVAGVATAIGEGRVSGLWNNEVSNALQAFNQNMEKWLPNYRTEEERNNKWWQNLKTMNFWADSFLKNMGFTVGAFYSGNAWLGAMKGLKALSMAAKAGKAVQAAEAATKTSGIGASMLGSFMSAFNEARIEANNNSSDFLELENKKIEDAYNKRKKEIELLPEGERNAALQELEINKDSALKNAQDRANGMGLADLIGNSVLLSVSNFWQFGKLYNMGYNNAKGFFGKIAAGMAADASPVKKQMTKDGIRYVAKEVAGGWKGVSNAFMEGFEEMNQKWIATSSGMKRAADSPDAYYEALTNPESKKKTMHTNKSLVKGFVDTYGNQDNWEEFAIGFLTGALGMPTVGKVNNSSAMTYLGRGKSIGLTGGIAGEIFSAKEQNAKSKSAETSMNRLMEKIAKQQDYMVMNKSFTDAMDGYATDGNKFEYKNAENNDDFASIAAFANAGRMDDLLEIVNQDYENMSREELQSIATHTTPDLKLNPDGSEVTKDEGGNTLTGGWRDPKTGKLLTSTEEGTEQMRQKLIQKRDNILQGIKDYSQAVSEVRARANGALGDSQIEELSWMNWKIKQFKNRYNSISSENKDFINKMKSAIDNTITSINRIKEIDELLQKQPGETELQKKARIKELNKGREKTLAQERRSLLRKGINSLDLSTENGQAFFKALGVLSEYFGVLQSDRSLEDLGLIISNNKDITDVLQNDEIMEDVLKYISGVDSDTYAKAMEGIGDMAKIGIAAKSFMDKYIEFMTNPLSQQKHRDRIDKKQKNKKDLKDSVDVASELDKMEVNDIVAKIKDGGEIPQELKDKLDEASKAKLDEADKIIEAYQKRLKDIEESDAPDEVKKIAIAQLEDSLGRAKSVKELFDTEKQAYLDREVARQASGNEPFTEERAAKLEQAIEDARELHMNFNEKYAEEALNKAEEGPEAAVKKGEESEETPGADPHAKSKSEQQLKAERKKTTKSEDNEKIRELKSKLIRGAHTAAFTNPSLSTISDDDLEKAVNFTFSQIKKHAKTNTFADIIDDIKETDQGKIALMAIPISDNSSVNLEELYNLYKEDIEEEEKPQSEKREQAEKGKKQELMTVVSDDEDIDATDPENIDPEARELFLRYKGKKKQYWRRNIPEFVYVPYSKDKTKMIPIPYDVYIDTYRKNKPYAKRDKEVYRLLKEDGAFERRNSGKVKEGSVIHFITKPEWNKKVSEATGNKEIVILMAVENENHKLEVVGDVSSKYTDEVIKENSPGLPAFVDRFEKAYNKAGKINDEHWEYKAETVTVGKVLVGTVQYSEENHTLNKIFGDNKFELGIIVDDGGARTVRTSNSDEDIDKDNSIISPRSGKRGQTVLLIPTNSNNKSKKYITVRVTPQRFNLRLHKGTTYYNALRTAVENIVTSDKSTVKACKDALADLLCIPDSFSIGYDDETGEFSYLTLYSSRDKAERKRLISQGQLVNLDIDGIVDKILKKLSDEGLLIKVDLKSINGNYKLGKKTIDYNSMIGEVCTTNLPIGTTHTVNNWFITSYSQEEDGEFKEYFDAKDVKSLKFNPTPSGREVAKVNRRRKAAISDETEETKEEKEVKEKAKEAAKKTPKRTKTTKVVKTTKVTRTLEDNEEIAEVEDMHKTGESNSKGDVIRTDDECDEAFKLSSLPKNTKTKEAWADLTSEQKNKILDLPKVKQKACVQTLVSAHSKGGFYESRLIGNSVDATIASYSPKESKSAPKLRAVSREASKVADNARERRIIERALPQLSNKEVIRIHKGLIKISKTAKPEYAWGKFQEGIITLSDIAARGTLYHESFHFVFNSLLTDEEIVSMYNAAKDIYGDKSLIELEELMAEDFRRFMQFQEDLQEAERTGNTREWDRIKREIKSLLHKLEGNTHVLNSVFSKIYNKEYANRSVVYRDAATIKEMADIKEKAIADGTFMKAPNGKPTKLNERQWLLVRTRAFKRWFGDWERAAREALRNAPTPIKPEFKGKLIFAQAGTGKTSIADNVNVFDSDYLLAQILGVQTSQVNAAFNSLSFEKKKEISQQYAKAIADKVAEGKTVITARLNSLKDADIIVYNESAELSDARTSSLDRSNNFKNSEYQKETLKVIQDNLKGKQSYALKDGEYLSNIILTDPTFNNTQNTVNSFENINELLDAYLQKFGFNVQELEKAGYSIDLLERTINISDASQVTEATGELIAYMSMFNPTEKELIVKMAIKDGAISRKHIYTRKGNINAIAYRKLDKSKYFKIIGKTIAEDLKYQFDYVKRNGKVDNTEIKKTDYSLLKEIRRIIRDFFNLFLDFRITRKLFNYSRQQATNIVALNDSFVKQSVFKPGDEDSGFVTKVDLKKALDENPYELDIIRKLTSLGFALAGSASISVQGDIYRPAENPLHDIDFDAGNVNRGYLDKVLPTKFENIEHVRTINDNTTEIPSCETYITFNVPFTIERPSAGMAVYSVKHKETGKVIASFVNSDLTILDDSVKGKFLDFFVNHEPEFSNITYDYNGETLLLGNQRSAFSAKLFQYNHRIKDIWDFNRFIPNERKTKNTNTERYNKKGFEMLIGIPGSGKSTYLKQLNNPNVQVVSPDDIRREITGSISDQSKNKEVWEETERRINSALEDGKYVILDATNVDTKLRRDFVNRIKLNNGNVNTYAIMFDANPEESKRRIANDINNNVDRSNVPPAAIDRMYEMYQDTKNAINYEGFSGIYSANGEYETNASKVVDENGEPLQVYHHTDNPNLTKFSTEHPNYFSQRDNGTKKAIFFDENPTGTLGRKYDIPVFLNIRDLNTYNLTKEQLHQQGSSYTALVNKSAEQNDRTGGVHMEHFDDNKMTDQDVWVVHHPNQIKSVNNIGTFNEDDDIRYRRFETTQEYDEEIQKLDKELDQKTPKVENELNDAIQQFKEKYKRVKERLANVPVIVLNNKHYYAVNTGRSVDSQYYGELYKSTLMKDYLEGIGDVISYKGYYFDIVPVLRTNAQFKDYVLEHDSELRDAYDEVNYLDEELARLEVEKDDLEMSKKYEEELAQRRIQRLQYENLSEAEKDILKSAGITEESWEEMTIEEKENRERCLF